MISTMRCDNHHNISSCNDEDDDSRCAVSLEIELLESDVPTRSKDDTIGQHSYNDDDDNG